MDAAREACLSLGHDRITTGHMLIGLLGDPGSEAARALADLGVTPGRAREAVATVDPPGGAAPPPAYIPFDASAKRAFEGTYEAARAAVNARGDLWIGPTDLLLGVAGAATGPGARALASLGVTAERLAARLERAIPAPPDHAARDPDEAACAPTEEWDASVVWIDGKEYRRVERPRSPRDLMRLVCVGTTLLGVLGLLFAVPESMSVLGWTADAASTAGARARAVVWQVGFLAALIALLGSARVLATARGPDATRQMRRAHAVVIGAGTIGVVAGVLVWSRWLFGGTLANVISLGLAMTVIAIATNGLALAIPTLRDPVDPPPPGA